MTQYTVHIEEDENGDLILPLPQELLQEVGWKENDTIEWKEKEDGSYMLSKSEKEWVLVETTHTFRMRYMVQVPKGKSEWALDTVTCEEAKEFSQQFIGEQIVSHRIVTEEEAIEICDVDNEYCKSWSKEQKQESFFTFDNVGE